jgi:hypothetical protein
MYQKYSEIPKMCFFVSLTWLCRIINKFEIFHKIKLTNHIHGPCRRLVAQNGS